MSLAGLISINIFGGYQLQTVECAHSPVNLASNSNLIPLNPPSKGGLPIRFPPFLRGVRGAHHSSPPNLKCAQGCTCCTMIRQSYTKVLNLCLW